MSVEDETWDRPVCNKCGEIIPYGKKGEHKNCITKAEEIWFYIFQELYGRKGFEDWWDSLDQEIVEEISEKIEKVIDERLS